MNLTELESLCKEYNKITKGIVDFDKYTYYAITHHSTVIEGSTLTESQVINLLEYGKTALNKPFEHHQMVFDHYKALLFIIKHAKEKNRIDLEFLKKTASILMKNTGSYIKTVLGSYDISNGDFRLSSVRAGNRSFPDYKKVPILINDLIKEVNQGLEKNKTFKDKCELAFKFHFDFVSIHPFGDGNGRTSRLMMNFVQAYFKLPLSPVFKENRIKYINALERTREKNDITVFYKFMFSQYEKFLKNELKTLKKNM